MVKGDRYLLKGFPAESYWIDAKLATREYEDLCPSALVPSTVE